MINKKMFSVLFIQGIILSFSLTLTPQNASFERKATAPSSSSTAVKDTIENKTLPSCLNPTGSHLCKGLGGEDAAGNPLDLTWCKNNIIHSINNAFTNELFNSNRNVFSKPLHKESVDYLFNLIGCITDFVAQNSNNPALPQESNNLINLIQDLINTTKLIYNTTFSKAGPVTISATTNNLLNQLHTMRSQVRASEDRISKVDCTLTEKFIKGKEHYTCKNKLIVKDFLITLAAIIKEITDKVIRDLTLEKMNRDKSGKAGITPPPLPPRTSSVTPPPLPPRPSAIQSL